MDIAEYANIIINWENSNNETKYLTFPVPKECCQKIKESFEDMYIIKFERFGYFNLIQLERRDIN